MPGSMNPDTGPGILGLAVFLITVVFMAIAVINLIPRFWGRKPASTFVPQPTIAMPARDTHSELRDQYAYMARHGYHEPVAVE
jgi:hypothetical protein